MSNSLEEINEMELYANKKMMTPNSLNHFKKYSAGTVLKRSGKLIEAITRREQEVLDLIAAGLSNQEIADELVISVATVKRHTVNIYGKLGVNRRTQAVATARALAILQ